MTNPQKSTQLPVCYHPTLVVLVDDDTAFLESAAFQLSTFQPVVTFDDVHKAAAWLKNWFANEQRSAPPLRVSHDDLTFSLDRRTVQLEVDHIFRQIHDIRRFLQPAVVIVDYEMPQMDGLTFCESLRDLPCKTILLTGTATELVAVRGFNEGLIDRYVRKGSDGSLPTLEADLAQLQKEYFIEQTYTMYDLLRRHSYAFLSDPAVARAVEGIMQQYQLVEYYLYPNPSGLLMLARDGKAHLMVIETEAGLLTHVEAAEAYDAPEALIRGLQNLELVPFFWPGAGMYTPACVDWIDYCVQATPIEGKETYYYGLFEMPKHLLPQNITNHFSFIRAFDSDPDQMLGLR